MIAMLAGEFGGCAERWQRFAIELPQEQSCGDVGVVRLAFDAGASGENHRLLDLLGLHAVVEILQRLVREVARGTVRLHAATSADETAADALRVERLTAAVGERDEQLRLRCAFNRAVAPERAGFAPFFAIEDELPRGAEMARFHQLRFNQVLDELDFQRVAFHRAGERGVDDGIGHTDDVVLRGAGERLVLMQAGVRLEGGFDGERDARLVEGHDAAVAFADVELLMLERIELGELELTVELFVRHVRVISSGGCRAAGSLRREITRGQDGKFWAQKIPRPLTRE